MGILDTIKAFLFGGEQKPTEVPPPPAEAPVPAPDDHVHPGDDPVPAPQDTEPPQGDPMREQI